MPVLLELVLKTPAREPSNGPSAYQFGRVVTVFDVELVVAPVAMALFKIPNSFWVDMAAPLGKVQPAGQMEEETLRVVVRLSCLPEPAVAVYQL